MRETLQIDADVRIWNEDQNPFDVIAGALRDCRAGSGRVAAEGTTRFFIVDGVRRAAGVEMVSGDSVVRPCRMIKSSAELALMQVASDVTMAALRYVHAHVQRGMSQSDIAGMMEIRPAVRRRGSTALQAIDYFVAQDGDARGAATREVERWAKFDIKDFHDAMLSCGRMPLDILQQVGQNWLKSQTA